jgi:hypothetical protein
MDLFYREEIQEWINGKLKRRRKNRNLDRFSQPMSWEYRRNHAYDYESDVYNAEDPILCSSECKEETDEFVGGQSNSK